MREPVYLRALEVADLDAIHRWHNDKRLYEMLGGPFHFVSTHAARTWLERKAAFIPDEVNCAICVQGTGKHVGNIYLHLINWIIRDGRLEIFIPDSDERSKGYGQSAIRQLLAHAFDDLDLKTVYLDVLTDNEAAMHVYLRCGFKVEGRFRNRVFKYGSWKDMFLMEITSDDYRLTPNCAEKTK